MAYTSIMLNLNECGIMKSEEESRGVTAAYMQNGWASIDCRMVR
jgi:hypothetical protein